MSREVGRRHAPAEEISLAQRAPAVNQKGELLLRLDALGQALEAEVAGEADHGLNQDRRAPVAGDVGGEAAVDLERVHAQLVQAPERGVAEAEVVDREPQ